MNAPSPEGDCPQPKVMMGAIPLPSERFAAAVKAYAAAVEISDGDAVADWRREATTFPRELSEAALAHIIADETEAAYSRGDVLDRRREMMMAWAQFLSVQEPSTVVQFPRLAKT
jgi:hypothetical protein